MANVGDSRAFLGRVDACGKAAAVPLTSDHTPDVPAEAARILAHQAGAPTLLYPLALNAWPCTAHGQATVAYPLASMHPIQPQLCEAIYACVPYCEVQTWTISSRLNHQSHIHAENDGQGMSALSGRVRA